MHIGESCEFIEEILPATFEEFAVNQTVCFAIVKNIEIIGEAAKHIPSDVKRKWRSIEWKEMTGMRNKLAHEYWSINYDIVWTTASVLIPQLYEQIKAVIEKEKKERQYNQNQINFKK